MVGDNVVYLWTLPIFHCNGWCFPWAITAGETRQSEPKQGIIQKVLLSGYHTGSIVPSCDIFVFRGEGDSVPGCGYGT